MKGEKVDMGVECCSLRAVSSQTDIWTDLWLTYEAEFLTG